MQSGDYPHWVKDEIGLRSKYFNLSFVTIEPNLLCVLCVSEGRLVQNNSESTNIQEIEVAFPPFLCSGDVLKSRMMASDLCYLILHFVHKYESSDAFQLVKIITTHLVHKHYLLKTKSF